LFEDTVSAYLRVGVGFNEGSQTVYGFSSQEKRKDDYSVNKP